jgi:hypothetical protein
MFNDIEPPLIVRNRLEKRENQDFFRIFFSVGNLIVLYLNFLLSFYKLDVLQKCLMKV